MKAIEIPELGMIIRHKNTQIDRDENVMFNYFSLEPKFGTKITQQIKETATDVYWLIEKKETPVLWQEMKDSSNAEMVWKLNTVIGEYLSHKFQLKETKDQDFGQRELVKYYDDAIGMNVSVYKDENPEEFDRVVQETGHTPEFESILNPNGIALQRCENGNSLGTMVGDNPNERQLLVLLEDILKASDLPLVVVDI